MLLEAFRGATVDEFRQIRSNEGPNVFLESSGGSILNHLGQHEAEHRGEIGMIIESTIKGS